MKYDEITIDWDPPLKIVGEWDPNGPFYGNDDSTEIAFRAILYYNGESVVYKSWTRKVFGYWEPDMMIQSPDPKLRKIADRFVKMGPKTFGIRFETLKARQDQPLP